MLPRDERLLDAAIEVLGSGGTRRLTHRAVDSAAGLPVGSTSNSFRTREALLVGVLGRILQREMAMWSQLTVSTSTVDGLATALGQLVKRLAGRERTLSLARRALFVEAGRQPELRKEIARAQRELAAWLVPLLAGIGSAERAADVRYLLALFDGLLGHQLAKPTSDFDPAAGFRALLRGLVDESPASSTEATAGP